MKKLLFLSAFALMLTACGGSATPNEEEEDVVVNLECDVENPKYEVMGTPMQMCYSAAWGTPKVEKLPSTTGSISKVTFDGEVSSPTIWYQSADYKTGAEDDFCFDCLVLNADVPTLTEQFVQAWGMTAEEIHLRKADIANERGVRIHHPAYVHPLEEGEGADSLIYYVPNAWEGYHVQVVADYAMAEELDEFVDFNLQF